MKPKLKVTQKKTLDEIGHYRFYYLGMFAIDHENTYSKHTKKHYRLALIGRRMLYSERDLCQFIYQLFGGGEYRIEAFQMGRKGLYIFWQGIINEDGFEFYKLDSSTREIKDLESEYVKAQEEDMPEYTQLVSEQLEQEKWMEKRKTKKRRYGFRPHLVRSGRRGHFHAWDEPDEDYDSWEEDDEDGY